MRWPRRGILIRLVIYIPLISLLAWRASGGCNAEESMAPEPAAGDELAPYRKVITLPDGTQQEIVELTPEQAEAVLGHPLPSSTDDAKKAPAPPADAKAEASSPEPPDDGDGSVDAGAGSGSPPRD